MYTSESWGGISKIRACALDRSFQPQPLENGNYLLLCTNLSTGHVPSKSRRRIKTGREKEKRINAQNSLPILASSSILHLHVIDYPSGWELSINLLYYVLTVRLFGHVDFYLCIDY